VESTSLNIKVMSVSPEYYVTESEVAERLHLKRQTVSLWFKGERHAKNPFPSPVMKLTAKSPLWRWYDVLEWLYQQKKISDVALLEHAKFMEHLNLVLFQRNIGEKKYREKIIKKLK
jgi:transcriptional regulator with XRE-family HTH domain